MKSKISVYFKNFVCYLCIVLTVIIDCLDEIVIQTFRRGLKLTHERLSSKNDNKINENNNNYESINIKLNEIDYRMNNVHEKYLNVLKLIQYRSVCINKTIHSFTLKNCDHNSFITGDMITQRNKYHVSETPVKIGCWLNYLNRSFLKGSSLLNYTDVIN